MPRARKPPLSCFECRAPATAKHHVVPRSLGGTQTVPLCATCHAKAHGVTDVWHTGELIKRALRHRVNAGLPAGGTPPYGWIKKKRRLEPCGTELAVLQVIRCWRAAGLSLRKIVATLNGLGLTPRGKNRWHPHTIARLCATATSS